LNDVLVVMNAGQKAWATSCLLNTSIAWFQELALQLITLDIILNLIICKTTRFISEKTKGPRTASSMIVIPNNRPKNQL